MTHDHDDGHGHDAVPAGDPGAHGPAEIPPVPEPRMITPARDDYRQPFIGRGLAWPLIWLVVAITFHAAARRWTGTTAATEDEHAPVSGHEAPPAK